MSRFGWLEMEDGQGGARDRRGSRHLGSGREHLLGHAPTATCGRAITKRPCSGTPPRCALPPNWRRPGPGRCAAWWAWRSIRRPTSGPQRGLDRFPSSPDLLAARAIALLHVSGMSRAMEYSDAAMQVKSQEVGPYPWIVRGELLLRRGGSRTSAKRCFSKALEVAGSDWYTHFLIGLTLLRRGYPEEARQRLLAGTSLERGSSFPVVHRG